MKIVPKKESHEKLHKLSIALWKLLCENWNLEVWRLIAGNQWATAKMA